MKISIRRLRVLIKEASLPDVDAKLAEIKGLIKKKFRRIHPSMLQQFMFNVREALESDFRRSGRLPSTEECQMMLEGDDDDEDKVQSVDLQENFPKTLTELESAWQLVGG